MREICEKARKMEREKKGVGDAGRATRVQIKVPQLLPGLKMMTRLHVHHISEILAWRGVDL